jgi:hypothetical protein
MVVLLKSTKLLAELVWVFPLYLVFPLLIFLSLGYHQRECMRSAHFFWGLRYTQCNMQVIILWFQMLFGWQACSLACEPPNVHLLIMFTVLVH